MTDLQQQIADFISAREATLAMIEKVISLDARIERHVVCYEESDDNEFICLINHAAPTEKEAVMIALNPDKVTQSIRNEIAAVKGLAEMLNSAYPHQYDNPSMFKAWLNAETALRAILEN